MRSILFALLLAGCGFHTVDGPRLDGGDDLSSDGGGRESLNGGQGGVLRFTIGATGLTACSTLTGKGTLPQQPFAVAFVPPDAVAVATRDGLWLVGVDDGTMAGSSTRLSRLAVAN